MHWRIKGFFYWLVAIGAYVAGWQVFEALKKMGLHQTVALSFGIATGFVLLAVIAILFYKWKQSRTPRTAASPEAGLGNDSMQLNARQQGLMAALDQAAHIDGDVVIQAGEGENPEYIVEKVNGKRAKTEG